MFLVRSSIYTKCISHKPCAGNSQDNMKPKMSCDFLLTLNTHITAPQKNLLTHLASKTESSFKRNACLFKAVYIFFL